MDLSVRSILVGFGIIVSYKFLRNLIRFLRTKHFYNQYLLWLANGNVNLDEYQHEVIELWENAGIGDAKVPFTQPAGLGLVATGTAGAFRNFPSNLQNIATIFFGMFNQAIGEYRRRMWQSINPFWWVEYIIFLPRHILSYLNLSSDSIFSKLIQLLYWFISLILAVLISSYSGEIREQLDKLFKQESHLNNK